MWMNRTHMNMVGPGKRHAKTLVGRERRRRDKAAIVDEVGEMPDRMEQWYEGEVQAAEDDRLERLRLAENQYGTCPDCLDALEPGENTSYLCSECHHDICPICWPIHNQACQETTP